MKAIGLSLLTIMALASSVRAADPVYAWDLNYALDPLTSNVGVANAEVFYVSVGPGSVYLGTGTDVNALTPGANPN